MVDVFGGARSGKGTRGPRGPPGAKGSRGEPATIKDLCTWMPQSVLKHLQEDDEIGCFLIEDTTKDIKKGENGVTEWLSRSSRKFNLTLSDGKNPAKLKEIWIKGLYRCYILDFKKSGYECDEIALLKHAPGDYGFMCFTFQTSDDSIQTLLSNYQGDYETHFEISVTSSEICITIFNADKKTRKIVPIQHNCRNWTTFFLEYRTSKTNIMQFRYIINNDTKHSGNFSFLNSVEDIGGCSIGSRWGKPFQYFNGDLSSLEIYYIAKVKDEQKPPDCLRELVINKQMHNNINK